MKTNICPVILLSIAFATAGCHSHSDNHEEAHDHDHDHAPGVIEFHDEISMRFGVAVDTIRPGEFHAVVKAAGRVEQSGADDAVASTPTAGIVHFVNGMEPGAQVGTGTQIAIVKARAMSGGDSNEAALAELESAQAEMDRVSDLYGQRLATQAELIAARAALARATAAYSPAAATGRVVSPIAGTVTSLLVKEGAYVNAGEPVAAVGKSAGGMLRVDLPARYFASASSFTDLKAEFPGVPVFSVSERGGRRVGNNAATDASASGGYIPLYFSGAAPGAPVGAPFTAYLIGDRRENVITVPTEAVSEQQGRYFVYELMKPEHYRKVPVTLGASDGERTEIVSGVTPGMVVVTAGMTAVRLAEANGTVPEGHSHNH